MAHWTAQTTAQVPPEQVLAVLTDPDAIRTWSPVPFELEGAESRLAAGRTARVNGQLAGVRVGFDVEVHSAGAEGLDLTAHGPVALDVHYELTPTAGGSSVKASVGLRRARGITGRLVASATGALLSAGALEGAAGRIARAAEATAA